MSSYWTSSYLEDARTALKARLTELEDEVRRTQTALAAITPDSEEDAAARYRRPGIHKDRISPDVRKAFDKPTARNPKGMLVVTGKRNHLSQENISEMRKVVQEILDREGLRRRDLEKQIMSRVNFPFTTTNLLRRLRDMEQDGIIERYAVKGNHAHTVWRLTETPAETADQNGAQTPTIA